MNFSKLMFLTALVSVSFMGLSYADTDVSVYDSKVSVSSLDNRGNVVDQKELLQGFEMKGISRGNPLPTRTAIPADQLKKANAQLKVLVSKSKIDIINGMIAEKKREIQSR